MIRRINDNNGNTRDEFEQRALKITGGSFYFLSAGLVATAIMNIHMKHKPETTVWGIVISLISMTFMWFLIHQKSKVGKALNSNAMLADAACSKVCVYLSVVLLVASVGFELTGIGYLDSVGALLIAWMSWKEGRKFFDKAKGGAYSCTCSCSSKTNVECSGK